MARERDELMRLVREEAALKLILDDGASKEAKENARTVLLTVHARIAYLRRVIAAQEDTEDRSVA